jgi:hypothetical protein
LKQRTANARHGRAQAAKLLVRALVVTLVLDDRNRREPVNLEAARLLARFKPPVSSAAHRALERGPLRARDYLPSHSILCLIIPKKIL